MQTDIIIQEDDDIYVWLVIEVLRLKYGYDFRHYSRAHVKRRILSRMAINGYIRISEMLDDLFLNESVGRLLLKDLSVNVTEMFRDPEFFIKLKSEILPVLSTYPQIRIWVAGCSSGEEVYSIAILLHEANLIDRSLIYATDFNENILETAKMGLYSHETIKTYSRNYQLAGGLSSLSDYYIADSQGIQMDNSLKKKIVFSKHNLVTDGSFGEMHLIVCRNVMIYFDKYLKERVVNLFHESLKRNCFLCLGIKESLADADMHGKFSLFSSNERIYIEDKFGSALK